MVGVPTLAILLGLTTLAMYVLIYFPANALTMYNKASIMYVHLICVCTRNTSFLVVIWSDMLGDIQWRKDSLSRSRPCTTLSST